MCVCVSVCVYQAEKESEQKFYYAQRPDFNANRWKGCHVLMRVISQHFVMQNGTTYFVSQINFSFRDIFLHFLLMQVENNNDFPW